MEICVLIIEPENIEPEDFLDTIEQIIETTCQICCETRDEKIVNGFDASAIIQFYIL